MLGRSTILLKDLGEKCTANKKQEEPALSDQRKVENSVRLMFLEVLNEEDQPKGTNTGTGERGSVLSGCHQLWVAWGWGPPETALLDPQKQRGQELGDLRGRGLYLFQSPRACPCEPLGSSWVVLTFIDT